MESHHRKWRLQFMRRIAGKTPEPVEGNFQTVEHSIEQPRQGCNLIVGAAGGMRSFRLSTVMLSAVLWMRWIGFTLCDSDGGQK